MLQLSRKIEYALIAVRHMALQPSFAVVTAKELSQHYQVSYELMAKVLQRLSKDGLLGSYQGVKGGYTLVRKPNEIRLSEIIYAIEGKASIAIMQCEAENPDNCSIHSTCTIRNPLVQIQGTINSMFEQMTVSELV